MLSSDGNRSSFGIKLILQMKDAAFTARTISDDSRPSLPAAVAAWTLQALHHSRHTNVRHLKASDIDFLPLELALQWSGISLRNRTPAQVWVCCARHAAQLLQHPGDSAHTARHALAFASRILEAAPSLASGSEALQAAVSKGALQLVVAACQELERHNQHATDAVPELRSQIEGVLEVGGNVEIVEGSVQADASRSVVWAPLLPGQSARASQQELQCWAALALVCCCGEAGVPSTVGAAMEPLLEPSAPFQDVTFVLDSGRSAT